MCHCILITDDCVNQNGSGLILSESKLDYVFSDMKLRNTFQVMLYNKIDRQN